MLRKELGEFSIILRLIIFELTAMQGGCFAYNIMFELTAMSGKKEGWFPCSQWHGTTTVSLYTGSN